MAGGYIKQSTMISKSIAMIVHRWLGILLLLWLAGCGSQTSPVTPQSVTPSQAPMTLFVSPLDKLTVLPRAVAAYPSQSTRFVVLNINALDIPLHQDVELTTPDNISYTSIFERRTQHTNGDVSLIGYLRDFGQSYRVMLTSGAAGMFGQVQTPDGTIIIDSDATGSWLINLDSAGLTPLSLKEDARIPQTPLALSPQQISARNALSESPLAGHTTVDVLIVYSTGFAEKYGEAAQTRLNTLVTLANTAFADSQVDLSLNVVHTEQVDYADTIDNDTALTALTNFIPPFQNISALRDTYGADVVTLVRPFVSTSSGSCGVAWLNGGGQTPLDAENAYSVVAEGKDGSFFCDEHTFAHEIGHGMGSAHDISNSATTGRYSYSYGYGQAGVFGTVMSYISPQSGRFSNPNINTCRNQVCGVVDQADNSRALTLMKDVVAAFRPTVVTTPPPPPPKPKPPSVTTQLASQVTDGQAVLRGQVNPQGFDTTAFFEFGADISYGQKTLEQTLAANSVEQNVQAIVSSLACGTTYQYRVVASNSGGVSEGDNLTFTTQSCPSSTSELNTQPATNITMSAAQLNGTIKTDKDINYYFEYGLGLKFGSKTVSQSMLVNTGATPISFVLDNLLCGRNYYYRLIGEDGIGNVTVSNARILTTLSCLEAPVVLTQAATDIRSTGAVLQGSINSRGVASVAYFEYGTPGALTLSTPETSIAASSVAQSLSMEINQLECGADYQFRVVASSSAGIVKGDVLSFTSFNCLNEPTISGLAARNIGNDQVEIVAKLISPGEASQVWFEYGETAAYGKITSVQMITATIAPSEFFASLSQLTCATQYHYKAFAKNSTGQTNSEDQVFSTRSCIAAKPILNDPALEEITENRVVLAIPVNPNGQLTIIRVAYGITTKYGEETPSQTVGAGANQVLFKVVLANLLCGTTYHYQITVENPEGTIVGNNNSFKTAECIISDLLSASGVTDIGLLAATLNAQVLPNNKKINLYFEYGTQSKNYANKTQTLAVLASLTTTNVSRIVSNLSCGATYFYRVVGELGTAVVYGKEELFSTIPCNTTTVSVITNPPQDITQTSAKLLGIVNPEGVNTTAYFEYGLDMSFGQETRKINIADGTLPRDVAWLVRSLQCDASYVYRMVAISEDGSPEGKVQPGENVVFQTLPCNGLNVDARVSWFSNDKAVIHVSVESGVNAETTVQVKYGLSQTMPQASDPVTIASGTDSIHLVNLSCGKEYFYAVTANDGVNTSSTDVASFKTKECFVPPEVTTLPALLISSRSATLQGGVMSNGMNTNARFNYGLTDVYGMQTEVTNVLGSFINQIVSTEISGLECETLYHYQIAANSENGTGWGENQTFTTDLCGSDPLPVPQNLPATPLAAGAEHSIAIGIGGNLISWGSNDDGQLGAGLVKDNVLIGVSDDLGNVLLGIVKVVAGAKHSLALTQDGRVIAWGKNSAGQLGDGTDLSRSFVKITEAASEVELSNVIDIAAGKEHSLAVKSDGTVFAWGSNNAGQIGAGEKLEYLTPVIVPGVFDTVAIAAGDRFSLALISDGSLYAWGVNDVGQLGNGNTESTFGPEKVQNATEIAAIAAGSEHAIALRKNGNVLVWGWNEYGQLGNGGRDIQTLPIPVKEADRVVSGVQVVGAGARYSMVLKDDGTLLAWGDNSSGQLGDGSFSMRLTPGPVLNADSTPLANMIAFAAGESHIIAVHESGALIGWGNNSYNQLGVNSEDKNSAYPIAIKDANGSDISIKRHQLIVDSVSFNIIEGKLGHFRLRPSAPPGAENLQVTVTIDANGDQDIRVTEGAVLVFTDMDWQQNQMVTLEALIDDDNTNGQTDIQIAAPGYSTAIVKVIESDKDNNQKALQGGVISVIDLLFILMFFCFTRRWVIMPTAHHF